MSNLSKEKQTEIKNAFNLFDKDKDGYIDTSELEKLLHALGLKFIRDDIQKKIEYFDDENSGRMEFKNILDIYEEISNKPDTETELKRAFQVFDKDGNGLINSSEIRMALTTCGDDPFSNEEVEEFLKLGDKNNDGFIDYKEFTKMMLNH